MREFDRKFGSDFLSGVPLEPGVYRFFDKSDQLIYVGKAIRLRRRLQQYRNATRLRRHRKMRKILKEGVRIEFEVSPSHRDACLRELELIQAERPRLNVSAAYSFLYPYIGVSFEAHSGALELILTHDPGRVLGSNQSSLKWHGCYRSRLWVREFFWAMVELLEFSAHRVPTPTSDRQRGVARATFRQVEQPWVQGLHQFLEGESCESFLSEWILRLVDNAGARARSSWIQERIRLLVRFHQQESRRLLEVRKEANHLDYPIRQEVRDRLFLEARLRR